MRKTLLLLGICLLLQQCTVPPPILTSTLSLDLPSGAGVSSNTNFTDFRSKTASGITTLTFTNQDADLLEIKINGLHPGNEYNMTGSNQLTGTFKINDEQGRLTQLNVEGSGVGFLNVTGMTGTGNDIKGMSGSFQVNIQVAGSSDENTISPTAVGTIVGNIGFNNSNQQ